MVNGTCVSSITHAFGRYVEVKHRGGSRIIVKRVKLQAPRDTDFCIRCGVTRRYVESHIEKGKKKVESVLI